LPKKTHSTWVPTGHPFIQVLNLFLEFRKAEDAGVNEGYDFITWLVNKKKLRPNTAKAYCFPLGENEFSLWGRTIEDLEVIVRGGVEALSLVLQNRDIDEDRRAWVCLNDARIVGEIRALNLTPADMKHHIVEHGFAGTEDAANVLVNVGDQVGKHFGLLDANGQATPLFYVLCKIWR
jgi:hypothetical protein